MSKSVIDEALADARQLKELAEENAKRALIEMVTPRIKQLVESRLLGEDTEVAESDEVDEIDESDDVVEGDTVGLGESNEYELNQESLRAIAPLLRQSKDVAGKLELSVSTLGETVQRACRIAPTNRTNVTVTTQIMELFAKIEDTYSHVHEAAALDAQRKARLEEKLESYYAELNEEFKEIAMKKGKLTEADDMTADGDAGAPPAPDAGADVAPEVDDGDDVVITIKGLKDVDAESLNVDVTVGDDDEEGDDDGDPGAPPGAGEEGDDADGGADLFSGMGESMGLDGDTILEVSDSDLVREIARMRRMTESDSDVGKARPKGGSKMPFDDFGGGSDDGDAWLDHDVTTAPSAVLAKPGKPKVVKEADMEEVDEADEMEESFDMTEVEMDESDDMAVEGQHEDDQESDDSVDESDDMTETDEVVECGMEEMEEGKISESTKRKSMIERKLKGEKARQVESQKKISAYKTEARKCRGTMREAQLKKRAMAELNRIKESQATVSRLQGALKKTSSTNGTVQSKLVKENNKLRNEVKEVTLFNTKLLYANKLLQTEGLSVAVRNKIIDALDAVQSLGEAKTLYTRLSESLRSRKTKMTETAQPSGRVLGSSSRVGKSAGTLAESANAENIEVDRWQTLAGLAKK